MALNGNLKKGDWIKLTSKTGSVIIGQAGHDKDRGGYARLEVVVGGDNTLTRPNEVDVITVNVNYWDVEMTHRNLAGQQ